MCLLLPLSKRLLLTGDLSDACVASISLSIFLELILP